MSEIIIYKAKDGRIEIDVQLSNETVWLSLNQMVELFDRDKSVISRHLANIFKNNELEKYSVVANFATTAVDGKTYQVDHYNLDAIISLGYRVNSKEGIRFRKWSSEVLKKYLIAGYVLHEKRLAEQSVKELQQSVALLQKTLISNELVNNIGAETIQVIMSYAKTWHLLLAYSANLLYFIIKDHPFSDGNKRIGCFIFLLYARRQNIFIKLNDNGLVALALLIAESNPSQKELMVRLIVNLLVD